jgi:hypothetical protein
MLADFKNRGQLEAWLGKQPPEVAVVLAARAALRVLPVVQTAKHEGFTGVLVLPVFRATVFSWVSAKYPAERTEFAAAAATAYASAVAAAAAAVVALATADAAAIRADYNAYAADAYAAVAASNAAAAAAARAADAYAASIRADYNAYAADAYAAVVAGNASAAAAARAADAYAAVVAARAAAAAARATAVRAAAAYAGARTYATAHAGDAAAPFFWSALSSDATHLEKGAAASAIARSPLWPQGQTDQLHSLWWEMKAALHAAKQDWQVWTIWYDDRLTGRVRHKTRELAYVRIEEALWDQGPAVVNAEIGRRIALSSYEDRLRDRTRDLEPELASERIEEAISGQARPRPDADVEHA